MSEFDFPYLVTPKVSEDVTGGPTGNGRALVASPSRKRSLPTALPLLPYFIFIAAFLGIPTVALFVKASRSIEGSTTPALLMAMQDQYRDAFLYTMRLSAISAAIGALCGSILALAISRIERPRRLREFVIGFSGVAANMGGIPLAFAFIAALGAQGLLTRILYHWGIDLYGSGFKIYNFWGIVVVYLYFQIPLMLLVLMPSIDGLKPTWRESAMNLGASPWQYWRKVGLPILSPTLMGGFLLLFANAFSAYATAYALSSGGARLIPVQIRFYLQGNTITGRGNLGYAMAAWMIIILTVVIALYLILRRRAERWRNA
jgi:putative spermidine/putrescine transport system permease protein